MPLGSLGDRVIASDPALEGLRLGARTTLAAILAAGTMALLSSSATAPVLAGAIAMMLCFVVNDPQVTDQKKTAAIAPVAAALGLCLGTLLAHRLWTSVVGFTVVLFFAVAAVRWGKRAGALGTMAQVGYFFALFFKAPLDELPQLLLAVFIAGAHAWLVRFIVIRDRPAATVAHRQRAFDAAVRVVLSESATLLVAASPSQLRRQRAALAVMNGVALSVDAAAHHDVAARMFAVEMAVGRVATVARLGSRALDVDLEASSRQALSRALLVARHDVPAALRLVENARAQAPDRIDRLLRALEHLRDARGEAVPDLRQASVPDDGVGSATAAPPAAATRGFGQALDADVRRAIQAAVAAVLAMLVGFAISPERWAWAVITAYVVLVGTTTRGDSLVKAAHRVVGTLAGVAFGLALWWAVEGHAAVTLALAFTCLFLAFAMMRVAYAWLAFWLTALIALLYGLLGSLSAEVLEIRVEETVAGALVGALVAVFVLPTRTRERVHARVRTLREELARFMAHVLAGDVVDLPARARALEQSVAELRHLAAPFTATLAASEVSMLVQRWSTAVFIVRHLARPDVHTELLTLPAELRTALATGDMRALLEQREQPALALFWLRELGDVLGDDPPGPSPTHV